MKIGIVGLGLMGGSLGRALVKRTEHTVYASDIDPEAMTKGALLSAYHEELTPITRASWICSSSPSFRPSWTA